MFDILQTFKTRHSFETVYTNKSVYTVSRAYYTTTYHAKCELHQTNFEKNAPDNVYMQLKILHPQVWYVNDIPDYQKLQLLLNVCTLTYQPINLE